MACRVERLILFIVCFTCTMDFTVPVPEDFALNDILDSLDLAKQSDGESEDGAISLAADSAPDAPQSVHLCSSPSSATSTPPLEVEGLEKVSYDSEEAPLEVVEGERADESSCSDALGIATWRETVWLFVCFCRSRFAIQINMYMVYCASLLAVMSNWLCFLCSTTQSFPALQEYFNYFFA